MDWFVKHWDELTWDELYDLLAVRTAVFVVEQRCPYQEADGLDRRAWHVFARDGGGNGRGWSKTSERFTNGSKRERTKRTAEHHPYLPPAGQTDSRKKRTPHKGVRVVLACRRHESALGSGGPKTPVPSRSERCLPGYLSDGNNLTPDPGKNGGGRLSETNRSRKP